MQTCDARATGHKSTRAHNLCRATRNTRSTCKTPVNKPVNKMVSALLLTALIVTGFSIIGLVGTAGIAEAAAARPTPPQEVVDAISAHFPPSQVDNALAVTYCESRWLTNERTAGTNKPNVGIFQINRVHRKRLAAEGYTWDDVRLNPDINAKIAADLWRTQGWRPWSCKKALPTTLRRMMPTEEELLWVSPTEQPAAEPTPIEAAPPIQAAPPAEPVVIAPPAAPPAAPPVTPPGDVTPPPVLDPLAAPTTAPMPPSTDLLPGNPGPITATPISTTPISTTPIAATPISTIPNRVAVPLFPTALPGATTPSLLQPGLLPVFSDPGAGPVIGEPLVVSPAAAAPILAMFSAAHRVIPVKHVSTSVPTLSARIRAQTTAGL